MKHLSTAIQAALDAGKAILQVYQSEIEVELKADQSPLTLADKRSHEVIVRALQSTGIPLLSEEGQQTAFAQRAGWPAFWLIDPLDGTKEFIKRNGEFTVNIALIEDRKPVLGVVYVPVKEVLYFGSAETGSYRWQADGKDEALPVSVAQWLEQAEPLAGKPWPEKYTIVASRSHLSPETESLIAGKKEEQGEVALISAGSSLKLCMVAERKAQLYPRLAPTMEWDTAAGHGVAKFAGCQVLDYEKGTELIYNKEDLHNPWFVVTP